ncbi:MAG: cysteate synthase [Phycisphaerae bacterium]|nr:cysteate synthase [Phycisphaerae bacterium]
MKDTSNCQTAASKSPIDLAADALRCVNCGREFQGLVRSCPDCPTSLLRMDYGRKQFEILDQPGIFRFGNWLPTRGACETTIGPVCYRGEKLADALGLETLYIGVNGYAPQRGATNMTATFKDFEAMPTLLHLRELGIERLILASAGNTARAFAYAGSVLDFQVHIVIPEQMCFKLWIPIEPGDKIHLTVVEGSRDYFQAIRLADLLSKTYDIVPEGGARNVARRDGMSTCMLECAREFRTLPDHYVQAVGSGTGGISAWEASMRLQGDGRFGATPSKLHLAQNAPFTPIHDAWENGIPIEPEKDVEEQVRRIDKISAPVLANRKPPYSEIGGVRDALKATKGYTYSVENPKASEARDLVERTEGFIASTAASVAIAAMIEAVDRGNISSSESVLLNITGCGIDALKSDYRTHQVPTALKIPISDITPEGVRKYGGDFGG